MRRVLLWGVAAGVMLALPLAFRQSFALSMLTQMGIAIIFALSYNMLLGQTGMLSFGHAVYYGLGAFACAHTLNAIGAGRLHLPVTLLPLPQIRRVQPIFLASPMTRPISSRSFPRSFFSMRDAFTPPSG